MALGNGQQQLESQRQRRLDIASEHRTPRVRDQGQSVESPHLDNGRARVLRQSQQDADAGVEVLAGAQASDVAVQAAEGQRVARAAGDVPRGLEAVEAGLRHVGREARVADDLGHAAQGFAGGAAQDRVAARQAADDEGRGRLADVFLAEARLGLGQAPQPAQKRGEHVHLNGFLAGGLRVAEAFREVLHHLEAVFVGDAREDLTEERY